MVGVDLYNALNSSAMLTYNNTFVPGGTWLQANSILTGRLARISAEFPPVMKRFEAQVVAM